MKKSLFILMLLAVPCVAKAQFGIGESILLGKILSQNILIYGKAVTTANQAIKLVNEAQKQMALAKQMSATINTMKYQGIQNLLWQMPVLLGQDRYGQATPWVQAVSGMGGALQAYQMATVPVPTGDWAAYYSSASPAQQQRIGSEYAWLQDTDAANAAALQAIGDSMAAMPSAKLALDNLVADSFASGFIDNPQLSAVALAQKQTIAGTMGNQIQTQNQQILVNILHQLVLMNTRTRNEQAAKLNTDSLIHQQQASAQQGVQGLGSALASFRF